MVRCATAFRLIDPDRPCYMGGYGMRTQKSEGILDHLKCVVNVVEIDGEKLLFCSVDSLLLHEDMVEALRDAAEKYGVRRENVSAAAIHTHAAPEIRSSRLPALGSPAQDDYYDIYHDFVVSQMTGAAAECLQSELTPVTAEYRVVTVEGFYGNRNGIGLPEDKRVTLVRLIDGGGRVVCGFINIACHPTVLGAQNLKISSDLLGCLSRRAQAEWGVYPVMMQGAAGDMSNRNYREGHDDKELARTGEGIWAQLSGGRYEPLRLEGPRVLPYTHVADYDADLDYLRGLRQQLEEQYERTEGYDARKVIQSSIIGLGYALQRPHIHVEHRYSVLDIGEWQIVRMPNEVFSVFGLAIKAASSRKLPVIWGYCNGYGSYMPAAGDYGKTYEATMALLPKGGGEEVTENLCRLVKE